MSDALADAFGDAVRVVLRRDPGATGNFEVTLATGEVLHSKKTGGGGRCESAEETAAVLEKLEAYLAAL